jgi:putative transposase
LERDQKYKLWQDSDHAKIILSSKFFYQKLNYSHNNPEEDMLVANPEDYMFSSARNYADLEIY